MNAESEAQMQHFKNSVYGQNDTTESYDQMTQLARIESRSVNFARWKSGFEDSGEIPEIPEQLLRHWVDADIASFRRLDDEIDVEIAADNIYSNYQLYDAYCKEMQKLAGDVAMRVEELNETSRKRGAQQDRVSAKDLVARMRDTESQRQLPENEDLVDGFASGGPGLDMKPADPALVARILESITYKGQTDGSVLYLLHDRPAFTDHGRQILLDKQALEDDQAILAAVLLAKEKYGGAFSLTGSEQFKRRALEVIAKHNVPIKLKSPAQEMMLMEIGASYPDFSNIPKVPAARDLLAGGSNSTAPDDVPAVAATDIPAPPEVLGENRVVEPSPVPEGWRGPACQIFDEEMAARMGDPFYSKAQELASLLAEYEEMSFEPSEREKAILDERKAEIAEAIQWIKDNVLLNPVVKDRMYETVRDLGRETGDPAVDKERYDYLTEMASKRAGQQDGVPEGHIEQLQAESVRVLRAIPANDWWRRQVALIGANFPSAPVRQQLLEELGPEPSADTVHWFDQAGNHVRNPDVDEIRAFEIRSANSARVVQALSLEDRLAVAKATQQQYILSGDFDSAAVHATEELEPLQEQWNDLHQAASSEQIASLTNLARNLETQAATLSAEIQQMRMAGGSEDLIKEREMELAGLRGERAGVLLKVLPQMKEEETKAGASADRLERLDSAIQEAQASCTDQQLGASEVNNIFSNSKRNEEAMSDQESKSPVLRGIARNPESGEFETTVLLFKGKGDYLQGFIMQDGHKHQVLAHINERKADEGTGEIKPNFLKLSKSEGQGDNVQWTELGFGNAVNKRGDEKPVYHDEVLFNVNGKTISARLGKDVSDELHTKLGFTSARVERPESESKEGQEVPKTPAPVQKAAAEMPAAQASAAGPQKRRNAAGARP